MTLDDRPARTVSGSSQRIGRDARVPPLMPEVAIVSTMVLIAAPIVLVGSAMLMAIARKVGRTRATSPAKPEEH